MLVATRKSRGSNKNLFKNGGMKSDRGRKEAAQVITEVSLSTDHPDNNEYRASLTGNKHKKNKASSDLRPNKMEGYLNSRQPHSSVKVDEKKQKLAIRKSDLDFKKESLSKTEYSHDKPSSIQKKVTKTVEDEYENTFSAAAPSHGEFPNQASSVMTTGSTAHHPVKS